jgi:hypothetical protein
MNELAKIETDIKTDFAKFAHFARTLELKFFGGLLHQKAVNPHPGSEPTHVWVLVESHDGPAPAPGEAVVTATSTETAPSGVVTTTSTEQTASVTGSTTTTTSTAAST